MNRHRFIGGAALCAAAGLWIGGTLADGRIVSGPEGFAVPIGAGTPKEITVLTWNTEHYAFDRKSPELRKELEKNMFELIRAVNPDIFLIQETYGSFERFKAAFPAYHAVLQNESGSVFSRFPLGETKRLWVDRLATDPYAANTSSMNFTEVVAGGLHLRVSSFGMFYLPLCLQVPAEATVEGLLKWEAEPKSPQPRTSRPRAIREKIAAMESLLEEKDRIPLIVGGDFNSMSHLDWTAANGGAEGHCGRVVPWPVSKAMVEAGFTDAYRAVYPDEVKNPGVTHPMVGYYPQRPRPFNRLDCVYSAGSRLKPISAEVLLGAYHKPFEWRGKKFSMFPSDHAPVLVRFAVRRNGVGHPLVTIRMNASSRPDDLRKIVEINRTHPGSADEYWFGRGGAGPRLEILKERWRLQAEQKKICEVAGIPCGFQQGVTLGHGSIYDPAGGGQAKAELHPFTDNAWQVGKDGKRMLMFCPRSPEVLAYEEAHAATLGETLRPVSLWLDDDLRMGFYKPDGCFCTNCLAAFGAKFGQKLTREELVERLFGSAKKDPVRRAWLDFLSESLAVYGAAARRGMNRTNPNCLVAYQSVDPMTLATGRDYAPLLRTLSDDGKYPTSIRIGALCYGEDVRELTYKMQGVAFETERIRRSGLNLSAVSYEQETYRREALHKTPEAIAVESALAFACGCDAVTEYYYDEKRPEPLWYYEEFAATMSAWRPYFERLAAVSRRTSLGGVARFIGSDFDVIARRTLRSATDLDLAGVGVPVTVMASGAKVRYVNADSLSEWGEGDAAKLLADGAVALVDASCASNFFNLGGATVKAAAAEGRVRVFDIASGVVRLGRTFAGQYPTHAERGAMLDAFDSLAGAKLPVRVERSHPLYVYPRVDGAGRVVAVTFYNGAAGAMLPTVVRIRRPLGTRAVWARPEAADLTLDAKTNGDELILTLPKLPARQVGTLFFFGSE